MKRILKYVVVAVIAIVAVSCEVDMLDSSCPDPGPGQLPPGTGPDGGEESPGDGVGPTTPIKRRPIVPDGKLKRPRATDFLDVYSYSATEGVGSEE